MGYVSDVAIAVKESCLEDKILEQLVKLSDQIHFKECRNSTYILFIIESTKWSEFDEEMQGLIGWLNGLDDVDHKFIRVGDDLTDLSIDGTLDVFDMNITRSITWSDGEVFNNDEDYDSIKVDLNIPSKESFFKKVNDIHVRCSKE